MDGNFTFDVLVLSGKSQWTSLSRRGDSASAQNEARKLVASKKHQGVKVMQETYDAAENRFSEKTVFKQIKSEQRSFQSEEEEEFDDVDDYEDFDDGVDWVLPVFGLVTFLAILLTVGIYFFDDKMNFSVGSSSDYYVYELPAVITNVTNGKEVYSVKINLQLELDGSGDTKAVEFALAQIMESVINQVQNTDADDLQRSERIQLLRAELQKKIQDAMGETNLNGVLFRDIQVF